MPEFSRWLCESTHFEIENHIYFTYLDNAFRLHVGSVYKILKRSRIAPFTYFVKVNATNNNEIFACLWCTTNLIFVPLTGIKASLRCLPLPKIVRPHLQAYQEMYRCNPCHNNTRSSFSGVNLKLETQLACHCSVLAFACVMILKVVFCHVIVRPLSRRTFNWKIARVVGQWYSYSHVHKTKKDLWNVGIFIWWMQFCHA